MIEEQNGDGKHNLPAKKMNLAGTSNKSKRTASMKGDAAMCHALCDPGADGVWLVPFIIILLTSVRSMGDLIGNGIFAWPKQFVFDKFVRAWTIGNFSTYFRNSLILIIVKVPLGIVLASLAAFPLAKMKFRGSDRSSSSSFSLAWLFPCT